MLALRATWRSGDAADCKSAHPGSIPGVASKAPSSRLQRHRGVGVSWRQEAPRSFRSCRRRLHAWLGRTRWPRCRRDIASNNFRTVGSKLLHSRGSPSSRQAHRNRNSSRSYVATSSSARRSMPSSRRQAGQIIRPPRNSSSALWPSNIPIAAHAHVRIVVRQFHGRFV
jgi:hypothetical protein